MKPTLAVTSAAAVVSTAVSAMVNLVNLYRQLYSCWQKKYFYILARCLRVVNPESLREKWCLDVSAFLSSPLKIYPRWMPRVDLARDWTMSTTGEFYWKNMLSVFR